MSKHKHKKKGKKGKKKSKHYKPKKQKAKFGSKAAKEGAIRTYVSRAEEYAHNIEQGVAGKGPLANNLTLMTAKYKDGLWNVKRLKEYVGDKKRAKKLKERYHHVGVKLKQFAAQQGKSVDIKVPKGSGAAPVMTTAPPPPVYGTPISAPGTPPPPPPMAPPGTAPGTAPACPFCAAALQPGWKACPSCGNPLPETQPAPPPQPSACPYCQAAIEPGWKACPSCGNPL